MSAATHAQLLEAAREALGRLSTADLLKVCELLDRLPRPHPERRRLIEALKAGPTHEEALGLLAELQAVEG